MGEAQCRQVPQRGSPLVVDWTSAQRANLEEAMAGGIAVVAYDCKNIELLPECSVPGGYGYMGVTTKEDVVQLASSDEIQANLPLAGATLAAGLQRGSTLDLALVQVGKRRTPATEVKRAEVPKAERCAKATHFVRGAHVGAFAMNVGTVGKVRASAEVFGFGGGGSSESSKSVAKRDGSRESCARADTTATTAPNGCAAVLRVELIAIDGIASAAGSGSDAEANGCPQGLVRMGGKCTLAQAGRGFDCSPDHPDECREQCNRGSMVSCAHLGLALHYGSGGVERDVNAAGVLYTKACAAGVQDACAGLGLLALRGIGGVPRDVAKYIDITGRACDAGEARGCSNLGTAYEHGQGVPVDKRRATDLYERACAGGFPTGCSNFGAAFQYGHRGTKDPRRALQYYEVACKANSPAGCMNAGSLYLSGVGTPADATQAAARFQASCELEKSPDAGLGCNALANLYLEGKGVERNVDRAVSLLQQGCQLGDAGSCGALMNLYRAGKHVPKSDLQANRVLDDACRARIGDACSWLGGAYAGGLGVTKSEPRARELYTQACELQSGGGCSGLGHSYWDSTTAPDHPAALAAWERGCDLFDGDSCHSLAWSLENGQGPRVEYPRAVSLYEINCQRGSPGSCMNLGTMYQTGRGVPRDEAKAIPLLERGCDLGQISACNNAGVIYRDSGTEQNLVRAAALFEKGCVGKEVKACFNLARAYRNGDGVPQDAAKDAEYSKLACLGGDISLCRVEWVDEVCAASLEVCTQMGYAFAKGNRSFQTDGKRGLALFRRACDAGHPNGCYGLADAYQNGWGTPVSDEKSKAARQKACSLGMPSACR